MLCLTSPLPFLQEAAALLQQEPPGRGGEVLRAADGAPGHHPLRARGPAGLRLGSAPLGTLSHSPALSCLHLPWDRIKAVVWVFPVPGLLSLCLCAVSCACRQPQAAFPSSSPARAGTAHLFAPQGASRALSSLWRQMESGEERLLAITALLKSAFSKQDL